MAPERENSSTSVVSRSRRTASATTRSALASARGSSASRSTKSCAWPLSEASGLRISWPSTADISPKVAR
jgi:hypothetical protein